MKPKIEITKAELSALEDILNLREGSVEDLAQHEGEEYYQSCLKDLDLAWKLLSKLRKISNPKTK